MSVIKVEDLIQSVADGLQFISYYHPKDFVQAMYRAYEHEASKPAKDAIGQILINSHGRLWSSPDLSGYWYGLCLR